MINRLLVEKIIENALLEDINGIDITNEYLIEDEVSGEAILLAKEDGIVCGLEVFKETFCKVDSTVEVELFYKDGDSIKKGENLASIKGRLKYILQAERVALNLLQRMSGIATKAHNMAELVKGTNAKVVDTRKTTPGLRILEKYAVKIGGCYNHRYNLCDTIMIKDNHIKALGGITKAVEKAKENVAHAIKIEVEVESIEQFKEAVELDVDIIMLDNMCIESMKECMEINEGRKILEASGNISEINISEIAKIGIDIISIGALTHSVKSLDLSLNIKS